jgi:hypothetical protein
MLDLKLILIAAGAAFAVGSGASWWITADYKESKYKAILAQIQVEALQAVQASAERALAAERAHNEIASTLEVQHVEYQQNLNQVRLDNQRLADELGGLRDPHSSAASGGSVSPAAAAPAGIKECAPSARLSVEATRFLLEFAAQADRAAAYAKTCQQWIAEVEAEQ